MTCAYTCTAPELDAGSVSCSLAGCVSCGKIAVRVCPSAVPDHDPGLRLAGPAGPQPGLQGRGDHGAPSRGHDAPAPGRPARAGLGRPRGPGGTGPVAASRGACSPTPPPGNPACPAT